MALCFLGLWGQRACVDLLGLQTGLGEDLYSQDPVNLCFQVLSCLNEGLCSPLDLVQVHACLQEGSLFHQDLYQVGLSYLQDLFQVDLSYLQDLCQVDLSYLQGLCQVDLSYLLGLYPWDLACLCLGVPSCPEGPACQGAFPSYLEDPDYQVLVLSYLVDL